MNEGYEALRGAAAWLDLSARGKVWAKGRDRVRLLHNLTTNDIKGLAPGQGCYAFLLTPQGRIQADLNLFSLDDRFLLDTEPETRERLLQLVRKYIIADDVKLEDASEALWAVGVEGPAAGGVLASLGAPRPANQWAHEAWGDCTVSAVTASGQPGFRIFAPSERQVQLIEKLERAGAKRASSEALRTVRIENGVPRYGEDISDTTLPQETGQMQALHFNKGCYLGQEIVERIRARGHVNRALVKLRMEGEEPPAAGTKVEAEGTEAGAVTSAAFSPAERNVAALAYVRTPYARPGAELSVLGCRAAVV